MTEKVTEHFLVLIRKSHSDLGTKGIFYPRSKTVVTSGLRGANSNINLSQKGVTSLLNSEVIYASGYFITLPGVEIPPPKVV